MFAFCYLGRLPSYTSIGKLEKRGLVSIAEMGDVGGSVVPQGPDAVWAAVLTVLEKKKIRKRSDEAKRLEVNLGMSAFTGNLIATVTVQPAPDGGSLVRFGARMGFWSSENALQVQRIERERHEFFASLTQALSGVAPETSPGRGAAQLSSSVADELAKLAALRDDGVLTEAEFQAEKAKVLGA